MSVLVSAWNPRARALQPVLAGSFPFLPKRHHLRHRFPIYQTRGQWLRLSSPLRPSLTPTAPDRDSGPVFLSGFVFLSYFYQRRFSAQGCPCAL